MERRRGSTRLKIARPFPDHLFSGRGLRCPGAKREGSYHVIKERAEERRSQSRSFRRTPASSALGHRGERQFYEFHDLGELVFSQSRGTRDALALNKVGKQEEIASCHSYTVLNADTKYQQQR